MKFLDCFCGLGGVSDGFHREGFECTGIEIDPKIAKLYPYKVIVADMRDLKGEDFKGYDVIWGSPPCRDFSQMAHVGYGSKRKGSKGKWAWKVPPNPEQGLKLVTSFLQFVEQAKPTIWIMENVPGLIKHLEMKPNCVTKITPTKKRVFWGNYPAFLMPLQHAKNVSKNVKGRVHCIQGKFRKWKRAKIPLACSLAFARACKTQLMES